LLQNKEDASELLERKVDLERQKKEAEDLAIAKEAQRDKKIKTIGNYVHDTVPVSNNEVRLLALFLLVQRQLTQKH